MSLCLTEKYSFVTRKMVETSPDVLRKMAAYVIRQTAAKGPDFLPKLSLLSPEKWWQNVLKFCKNCPVLLPDKKLRKVQMSSLK